MSPWGKRFLSGLQLDATGKYLDDDLDLGGWEKEWLYDRELLEMSKLPEWA